MPARATSATGALTISAVILSAALVRADAYASPATPAANGGEHSVLLHVLLAMTIVMLLAQLIGRLFTRLDQPAVIGEMFAGIVLGPSLLGRISPAAAEFILPASIAPHLKVVAEIGVVLYMFLVGVELDVSRLRERARVAVVISATGIAVPLLLGSGIAGVLYAPWLNDNGALSAAR